MGTVCALSYANLFMAQFEEKDIYPYIKDMALLHLKYINDIYIFLERNKRTINNIY